MTMSSTPSIYDEPVSELEVLEVLIHRLVPSHLNKGHAASLRFVPFVLGIREGGELVPGGRLRQGEKRREVVREESEKREKERSMVCSEASAIPSHLGARVHIHSIAHVVTEKGAKRVLVVARDDKVGPSKYVVGKEWRVPGSGINDSSRN